MGQKMWRALVALVALAVLPIAVLTACSVDFGDDGSTAVSTNVNDFSFDSLDVQYTLGRADDGTSTLRVEETFVARFPDYDQNRGMRRSIPD